MAEAASSTPGISAGGDIANKFNIAKERKAAGDEAFKNNDFMGGEYRCLLYALPVCSATDPMRLLAFRNYHEVSGSRSN